MPRGKKAAGGKINKMECVRQVLAKHGKGTMPTDIARLVKEEHGADMSVDMASTYKSAVLKKRKGKRGPKPGWKTAVVANGGGGALLTSDISLDDISAVKKVCDRIGADKVRQLAGVLG
jgi:hypothetical protein